MCLVYEEAVEFLELVDPGYKGQVDHHSILNKVVDGQPLDPQYLTLTRRPIQNSCSRGG
jgi:hypothetical protein